MTGVLAEIPTLVILFGVAVALVAGLIKGVVGFAMPMVFISGLTLVLPPDLSLAGLMLPTLVSNAWQALRQGPVAAWNTIKSFKLFLICGALALIAAAQLVSTMSDRTFLLSIGIPVTLFAFIQVAGWRPRFAPNRIAEVVIGLIAGVAGGISGIWGPPTVAYLTAINTPKLEQMRIQGVVYGMGSFLLVAAHLRSGILNAQTVPLTVLLTVPAVLGTWLGFQLQDRVDQALFRKITIWVILIAGVNLLRRGLFA
ncbi:MAG: sulfite exporter TauE/SafE family protein [Pseudomonadota bacterium]